MNSNFKVLKKIALCCLLGVVSYGNIGNAMEEEQPQFDINIVNQEQQVENTVKFENNRVSGTVDGYEFDIDTTEFKFKNVETFFGREDLASKINSNIEHLQKIINHVFEGRLRSAMYAFDFISNKDNDLEIVTKTCQDIFAEYVKYINSESQYNFSDEELNKVVQDVISQHKEEIARNKIPGILNENEKQDIIKAFKSNLKEFLQILSEDTKKFRYYESNASDFALKKCIFNEDNNSVSQKVAYNEKDIRDIDQAISNLLLVNPDEQVKDIKYSEASNLLQYILKYASDEDLANFFEKANFKCIQDDEAISDFRDCSLKLRMLSTFIMERIDIMDSVFSVNKGDRNVFEEKLFKLSEEKKQRAIQTRIAGVSNFKKEAVDLLQTDETVNMMNYLNKNNNKPLQMKIKKKGLNNNMNANINDNKGVAVPNNDNNKEEIAKKLENIVLRINQNQLNDTTNNNKKEDAKQTFAHKKLRNFNMYKKK